MKYSRKSFFLFWLIAEMLFGTVSASAASAKPETPVLSGTAAGNRVTLNWNKVKKASGYQIFLYYKPTENTNAWKGSRTGTLPVLH